MSVDPRIPRAFASATEEDPHAPAGHDAPSAPPDPLRLCVATTVALIAWVLSPPVAVVVFGTLAIVAYVRAYRSGLLASRCKLGDTRLVLGYLSVAVVAGVVGIVVRLT